MLGGGILGIKISGSLNPSGFSPGLWIIGVVCIIGCPETTGQRWGPRGTSMGKCSCFCSLSPLVSQEKLFIEECELLWDGTGWGENTQLGSACAKLCNGGQVGKTATV